MKRRTHDGAPRALRQAPAVGRPPAGCHRATAGASLIVSLLVAGCGPSDPAATPATPAAAEASNSDVSGTSKGGEFSDGLTATDILGRMSQAYSQAAGYLDNAQYHQRYVRRGEGVEYDVPAHVLSVMFERPNKIRLNRHVPSVEGPALDVAIVSNGRQVRAYATDFPGQILEFPAPGELSAATLAPQPALKNLVFPVPLENVYPQLELLLAKPGQPAGLSTLGELRRLPSEQLADVMCFRVQINQPDEGSRVLWIAEETFRLMRMEMPTKRVRAEMDPGDTLSDLALWIDFHDAAFDPQIDATAFEMEVPAGARRLTTFVSPPPSPPPGIGKTVDEYRFHEMDGTPLSQEQLLGKVVVLDFWFTGCQPCRVSMPALDELFRKYADREEFAMFAVSVDTKSVSARTIKDTLKAWGGTMPSLRDLNDVGQDRFDVTGWPTTLLLGTDGKIHRVERGARQDYSDWNQAIDTLLAGGDVAAEILGQHRQQVADFERAIAEASLAGRPADPEITASRAEVRASGDRLIDASDESPDVTDTINDTPTLPALTAPGNTPRSNDETE